jgi:hypothetical protein
MPTLFKTVSFLLLLMRICSAWDCFHLPPYQCQHCLKRLLHALIHVLYIKTCSETVFHLPYLYLRQHCLRQLPHALVYQFPLPMQTLSETASTCLYISKHDLRLFSICPYLWQHCLRQFLGSPGAVCQCPVLDSWGLRLQGPRGPSIKNKYSIQI